MRFLFGLIIGAMLTILVATVLKFPTRAAPDGIHAAWQELLDKVLPDRVSKNELVTTPEVETPPQESAVPDEPANWPASPWLPVAATEPPVVAVASSPFGEALDEPSPRELTGFIDPALLEDKLDIEMSEVTAREGDLLSTTVIWEPFHSEVSATGFAKRLSLQLGYPFQVTKDGPARYLVVFDYQSDDQRALLVRQIATLTGYQAP